LSSDIGEVQDLARQHPEQVELLLGELHKWQQSVGAQLPTVNAAYDLAKPSGRFAARPGS